MADPIRIGIVGAGKIARDQHVRAICESPRFELSGAADPVGAMDGIPMFRDLGSMLAGAPDLQAVAICTPPQFRAGLAQQALSAGLHVILEKPPTATVIQGLRLVDFARAQRLALFAAWHSREASAVPFARQWLAKRKIRAVRIFWREDVRHWHPGQQWIWEAGGLGVFDPAINALSILTSVMSDRISVCAATLDFPVNRQAPIAAELIMTSDEGARIDGYFDFRQKGPQQWDLEFDTDNGCMVLGKGGSTMTVGSAGAYDLDGEEYPRLYAHFANLVESCAQDVDLAPLQLVADAFLVGQRREVEAFDD